MSENNKTLLYTVAGGLLVYLVWEKWGRAFFLGKPGDLNGDGIPDSLFASGAGSGAGSGGAGSGTGSGGAGGAGGAGAGGDYTALAAAIMALAAGVQLPNIQSVTKSVTTGTTELVPSSSGFLTRVLAYTISASGTCSGKWRSGSSPIDLWRIDLSAPAGNSGANLATAWPGFLFSTAPNDALNIVTDSSAVVSVTYWLEAE